MLGEIALTRSGELCVHTYTAPDDGWCVNSHIVETANGLVVVDAQYTMTYAREVVAYAAGLGKTIARLYVTHYHPDHLLGASAFSCPIYALPAVAAKIDAVVAHRTFASCCRIAGSSFASHRSRAIETH